MARELSREPLFFGLCKEALYYRRRLVKATKREHVGVRVLDMVEGNELPGWFHLLGSPCSEV